MCLRAFGTAPGDDIRSADLVATISQGLKMSSLLCKLFTNLPTPVWERKSACKLVMQLFVCAHLCRPPSCRGSQVSRRRSYARNASCHTNQAMILTTQQMMLQSQCSNFLCISTTSFRRLCCSPFHFLGTRGPLSSVRGDATKVKQHGTSQHLRHFIPHCVEPGRPGEALQA